MRVGNDVDEWNAVFGKHGEVVNDAKEQQSKLGKQLKKNMVGASLGRCSILFYDARKKCM